VLAADRAVPPGSAGVEVRAPGRDDATG